MPLEDGLGNTALADEVEALNSIYDPNTLVLQPPTSAGRDTDKDTTAILRLPASPISFLVSFPSQYPDVPPQILGTQSIGDATRKGVGEAAVSVLRDVLGRVWSVGQVCLFDLLEEAVPILSATDNDEHDDDDETHDRDAGEVATLEEFDENTRSAPPPPPPSTSIQQRFQTLVLKEEDDHRRRLNDPQPSSDVPVTTASSSDLIPPQWILSDTLTVNKSTFIARAASVHSLSEAQDALSHLLSTNKKVASATHNISAWRIKGSPPHNHASSTANANNNAEVVIQDSDDDGETAAGGRLLHLMQLMDVWNVLVVVTRWYGGVKLGPDRFRLINQVAREALLRGPDGGFGLAKGKEKDAVEGGKHSKGKGKGKKGK